MIEPITTLQYLPLTRFRDVYIFLSRLNMDASQFTMDGSFCYGKEHRLFSGSVAEHIKDMKKLWNALDEKPEWLSWEQILKYETKMKEVTSLIS
jgi:hypothetical protein